MLYITYQPTWLSDEDWSFVLMISCGIRCKRKKKGGKKKRNVSRLTVKIQYAKILLISKICRTRSNFWVNLSPALGAFLTRKFCSYVLPSSLILLLEWHSLNVNCTIIFLRTFLLHSYLYIKGKDITMVNEFPGLLVIVFCFWQCVIPRISEES